MNFQTKSIILLVTFYLVAACNNSSQTDSEKKDTATDQHIDTSSYEHKASDSVTGGSRAGDLMVAMSGMIEKMRSMKMSGDFDIDFANMMIQHHQGAIDMSQREVNSGKDEKIKAMAQKIISSQTEEITTLRDFVNAYKPSGMKHGEGELEKSMSDMEGKMKNMQMSGDIDKDFAMMMKDHHEGAIAMSKKELANGMSAKLKQMAQKFITAQGKEIKEFQQWLDNKK